MTKETDCWAWQAKVDAEPDPSEREKIYQAGLEDFPASVELTYNFARFMKQTRKDQDAAERLYRQALKPGAPIREFSRAP